MVMQTSLIGVDSYRDKVVAVDFWFFLFVQVCQEMGIGFTPPYLAPTTVGPGVLEGVNYASGASGILNLTGKLFGDRINFDAQLDNFANTRQDIISNIGVPAALNLFKRSLFSVAMGSNDFINNYLAPAVLIYEKNLASPELFVTTLVSRFREQLIRLFNLGARKIIVTNVGPIGCIPIQRDMNPAAGDGCVTFPNQLAQSFNIQLKGLIAELNSNLKGAMFVYADVYNILEDILNNYEAYGFENPSSSCCSMAGRFGGLVPCGPTSSICWDRSKYVFWDPWHPTDAANVIIAKRLLDVIEVSDNEVRIKTWQGGSVSGVTFSNIHMDSVRNPIIIDQFCCLTKKWLVPYATPYSLLIGLSNDIPASFVFGDSLLDVGNNNYTVSLAKANHDPYGIDFGMPTGRFSNGKTVADVINQKLGLGSHYYWISGSKGCQLCLWCRFGKKKLSGAGEPRVRVSERCGMFHALMSLIARCWKPFGHGDDAANAAAAAGRECKDGLLWFRDIGKFAAGDFSMAVVQANQVLEDQSQIESGAFGSFVGVYDGHGGPDCSRYVCDNLFRNLQAILAESQSVVTSEAIQQAFRRTEEGFTALVSELWSSRPQIATTGTCCLVGVICRQTLFVASLGDSRAVLGRRVGNTGGMAAIQLSTEHNANFEAIRQELKELHPNDPQIVVLKHGVWRVKGIIQS
ncbi:GDSL esterase/lipase [Glycine soja]|uniref:protein-serine/threonine phosphatase n=1 Tax=Glycine soja TaxID=3848 RepID=A0A445IWI7_GLYSO|nr:GDSL esterase/lipase [Glycine soja]